MTKKYIIKDSKKRQEYPSGMHRDSIDGKPMFGLLIPENVPYSETLLYRWAMHLTNGAVKYSRRNWELANSAEERDRFKESAFRHFMQWFMGEDDEDHASACLFNINAVETLKFKMNDDDNN